MSRPDGTLSFRTIRLPLRDAAHNRARGLRSRHEPRQRTTLSQDFHKPRHPMAVLVFAERPPLSGRGNLAPLLRVFKVIADLVE